MSAHICFIFFHHFHTLSFHILFLVYFFAFLLFSQPNWH